MYGLTTPRLLITMFAALVATLLLMAPMAHAQADAGAAAALTDGGTPVPAVAVAPTAPTTEVAPAPAPATGSTAQTAPDPDQGALKDALGDIVAGDFTARLVVAVFLIGAVFVNRRYGGAKWIPWGIGTYLSTTDRGGVILAFSMSFIGSVGHQILAGAWPPGMAVFKAAFVVAVMAIGGYVGVKRIVAPADQLPKATALA